MTTRGSPQSQRREAGAWAIVTGAAGGIGEAVVQRLLDDGWRVAATDSDPSMLSRAYGTNDKHRGNDRLRTRVMDVTRRSDVERVAAEAEGDSGVAGLVNIAGLLQDVVTLFSLDDDAQRRLWDVNYFGAQQCLRIFAKRMLATGGGSIVNITSINEQQPLPLHAYAPSKVALGALTRLAAGELGPQGIRVNAVAPGFTLTPIFREKIRAGKRDARVLESHSALGRLVETDEVAAAVSFLLGDESSAITGVSLPVDCGWLATAHWMNFRALAAPAE
jgi:NAD(P)-dependent dehydrogenase (short-subunit alcohol dehydrogenase family)